jgi:hypothetical protein
MHIPYHHKKQAVLAPEGARRLIFDVEKGAVYEPLETGRSRDPRRLSFVIQIPSDVQYQFPNGMTIRPRQPDRVILRIQNPRMDEPLPWERLRVVWGTRDPVVLQRSDEDSELKQFLPNDWPYLPVFQRVVKIEDGTLTIELASPDEIGAIAPAIELALLGGIQPLGKEKFYGSRALCDLLREALVAQLTVLHANRVEMYLELSGVSSSKDLSGLKKVLADSGLKHVSLNREELVQITSAFGDYFVAPKPPVPDTPIGIYWRAVKLREALGVDTVYVHDLELDILVRVDGTLDSGELERHRQAMILAKAAVPADLLRRANSTTDWDLVLSTESLGALLRFASDYATLVEPSNKDRQAAVREALMTRGFYGGPAGLGVSVVVAPGVWINIDGRVNLSGAGDRNLAVHAAGKKLF